MAASEETAPAPPTYGNWRRPNRGGIWGLGLVGTISLFAGLCLLVLLSLVSPIVSLVGVVLLAALLLPLAIKDAHGRSLLVRAFGRLAWRRTVSAGSHLYRSGPLGRISYGQFRLPGLAAASTLSEAQDAWGRPFALLTYPSTNHHVVVLECDADGASLVDSEQVNTWVAHWGRWLAGLEAEPGLVGVSVTVETAPDTGYRLQREVREHTAEDAPALAREMLEEVLETYPHSSARISTRIALTYSASAGAELPRRSVDDMAVELGNRLPELTSALEWTGAGVARPMTAAGLAEAVRVAYDPQVAELIDRAREEGGSGLTWSEAGPSAADEARAAYQHEGAYSITWCMSSAPRGAVFSRVLERLLAAHPDIDRKRVTLLYRPHTAAEAAQIVEKDAKDSAFLASEKAGGNSRRELEAQMARKSADEEAAGAGVTRFAMLVTATVTDRDRLPRVQAVVNQLAPTARIRLRPVYGAQAAAFAAALPIGLVLPLHTVMPTAVRDNL